MKLGYAALAMSCLVAGCATNTSRTAELVSPSRTDNAIDPKSQIDSWARLQNFNGVVAVRYPGGQQAIIPFGEADHISKRRLSRNSIFQTGSVGKLLVSITAFALAEEGKLNLDIPISRYLPMYRKEIGEEVTLAHLMSNRSGIADNKLRPVMGKVAQARSADPNIAIDDIENLPKSIDATIMEHLNADLLFEPGSQFDYANSNWILMQHVLETAADKPIGELLRQHVFEPAGMTASGTFVDNLEQTDVPMSDIAIGYNSDGRFLKSDFPLPAFIGGGSYTSAGDMLNLMGALYSGKLLSNKSLKRFSQVQTPEENYAFGGRIQSGTRAPKNGYSWQSGSNGATKMVVVHNIDTGYSFAALSNRAHSQSEMFDLAMNLEE